MTIPSMCRELWGEYLESLREAAQADRRPWDPAQVSARYYETCRFGHTTENANKAASAVLRGDKTATSSLLWEYELSARQPPEIGALSIVLDGRFAPVAVIETTAVLVVPFCEIDAGFAYDYGEGDRSLEFWRSTVWGYYQEECARLGVPPSWDMPMLCEQFLLVHPRT
ncbi:MAG: ASCH domain-containing protein [Gammaproteobacteria bacterium]|nr:ASCH domain-containing protein [Gammaproteobacteria bacterium]